MCQGGFLEKEHGEKDASVNAKSHGLESLSVDLVLSRSGQVLLSRHNEGFGLREVFPEPSERTKLRHRGMHPMVFHGLDFLPVGSRQLSL